MLKREWGAVRNGKLPQLFIPNKTALVPEFAVEELPLGRTAPLVPKFEGPALGQNYDDDDDDDDDICKRKAVYLY